MEKVRFGVAGLGYIGGYHARGAAAAPHALLVAGCDPDPEKRAAFAARHPGVRLYEEAAAMAGDPGVDAVAVGVPNAHHLPLGELFLRGGKHVLMEKPMALDAAQAEHLAAAARDAGRTLAVGHMWRFDPEARYLRDLVAEGRLGRVVKTKGYGIHAKWGPAGWFTRKALAGGGALIDMGVHAVDTVRFILGDPRPLSVYARIGTYFGDYDVDDTGLLAITWEGGATSVVESGWWHPHMDGPEAATQLFGTGGYARMFPTMYVPIAKDAAPVRPKFPPREEHCAQSLYTDQVEELALAVLDGRKPLNGPDVGLAVMRICDAAYRSSAEGRVVEL
ncbi:MAG: Gfo/Idh/MocA family oxidoreductase [Deltaproteobacteria bacterium]|nr:Gfo/Idh/MocA family oxidoreductase [Deltaproteobacteria bacterium]